MTCRKIRFPPRPAILRLGVGVTAHRVSAFRALSNFELLLENWRSSAYPLPFQGNIYFDTVGDLNEGNILVHPVVLRSKAIVPSMLPEVDPLPLSVRVSFSAFVTPRIVKSPSRSNVFGPV